jgi:hypothetical protein
MSQDSIIVECAARDHGLALHLDEEDGWLYLSVYISEFYNKQHSCFERWWERVKLAATALLGRDYLLEEIVLEPEAIRELAEFLAESKS